MVRSLTLLCAFFSATVAIAGAPEDDRFRVILLGTGTPVPNDEQYGPSILVEAGEYLYVVDCGRGCGVRLGQYLGAKDYRRVDTILLTHHHSDHTVGLPEIFLNGWLQQRHKPLRLYGPTGVTQLSTGLELAFAEDIRIRSLEADRLGNSLAGLDIVPTLVDGDGPVLEEHGIRISAFEVDHGHVEAAYGYRFDYRGRSVVISGDTGPSENLVRHAAAADVILHEVMASGLVRKLRTYFDPDSVEFITSIHTTPIQAGKIFAETEPRLAVYYHTLNDDITRRELLAETESVYSGDVIVGDDLMIIDVSTLAVTSARRGITGN